MAEPKTQKNDASVEDFLNSVDHEQKRADSFTILKLMEEISGEKPVMWGDSIVGFGSYTYKYATGRTGDWPLLGFSPRKQALTLYITNDFSRYEKWMEQLGKYKTSKACLYVRKLSDINMEILEKLIRESLKDMRKFAHSGSC